MSKLKPVGLMAVVLFTACQQLDETVLNESEELGEKQVSVEASIGRQTLSKTVVSNSENSFSFCKGDEMGVFISGESAYKWIMQDDGASWKTETPMKWPDKEDDETLTFYAYSPYTGDVSGNSVNMPDLSGQTGTLEGLSKYDFLVACCPTNYQKEKGKVSFTGDYAFNHASSLIVFTIKGDPMMCGAIIKNVYFEAKGIATPAKYVFEDAGSRSAIQPVIPGNGTTDQLTLAVNEGIDADGLKVYIIINPIEEQPLSFSMTYERDGTQYETTKVELKSDFSSNNMCTFSLSVNKGEVVITGAEITDWNPNALGDVVVDEVKKESGATE